MNDKSGQGVNLMLCLGYIFHIVPENMKDLEVNDIQAMIEKLVTNAFDDDPFTAVWYKWCA
jgi:hypothetical protein